VKGCRSLREASRHPFVVPYSVRYGWEKRVAIDVDRLTEPELIDLNRKIIERLRLLQQMRAHRQMLAFKIGDRVTARRIYVAMACAGPFQDEFALAHVLLRRAGA